MDFTLTANEPISIKHFEWLGFKNVNGALVHKDIPGEVQFFNNAFWYCEESKAHKKIVINRDIDSVYLANYYSRRKV